MSGKWPREWLRGFRNQVQFDVPLKPRNTWRVGGTASLFFLPETRQVLEEMLGCCHERGIPISILGSGANVLIPDEGIRGAVVSLERMQRIQFHGKHVIAQAGANIHRLATKCFKRGYRGLEFIAGVPGSCGGITAMNAGGRYGSIGNLVRAATVVDRCGNTMHFEGADIQFSYRTCNLRDYVIVDVTLELEPGADATTLMQHYHHILRAKERTQPLDARTAGCVFKNPDGHHAGALIEQAGLKNTHVGHAYVSEKHANFLLNAGNARAQDIMALIMLIQKTVEDVHGIHLEPEVHIWQAQPPSR